MLSFLPLLSYLLISSLFVALLHLFYSTRPPISIGLFYCPSLSIPTLLPPCQTLPFVHSPLFGLFHLHCSIKAIFFIYFLEFRLLAFSLLFLTFPPLHFHCTVPLYFNFSFLYISSHIFHAPFLPLHLPFVFLSRSPFCYPPTPFEW